MLSVSASIFLLFQPAGGQAAGGGWSLIPGIPNHYISVPYAELVTDLANKIRTVAFIVAAVLLAASLAVNASGWLIKDLNIREVLRTGVLVVALLALYSPAFGHLMSFGYNVGELIVDEKEVTRMVVETFRETPNRKRLSPGAGEVPADGGASDVKSGGFLTWLFNAGEGFADLVATSVAVLVASLCSLFFLIALFIMPSIWLIFATLLYIFGPLVISLGMIPRIGGKLLGNLFSTVFELSMWQAWFHLCSWLVLASNELVNKKAIDLFAGATGAQAVDSAYTSAEAASMGLIFACLYIATPLVIRYLVPISQGGALATSIVSKVSQIASTGAGLAIGGVGGAVVGATGSTVGKTGFQKVLSGVGGAFSGGFKGAVGSTRSGFQMLRAVRSANPVPERPKKSA